jgi:alanyl-tRNA synthetase
MTTRLYYDSDTLSFDAIVTGHDGDDCRVILDRSAFYPTSGGQPHDTGLLGDVRLIDVIDAGEEVVHVTERPVPLGPVHGEVDRARRHDFTVQHTAQHLLSALAGDWFGWETASVHFGEERSLIEFEVAEVGEEQLRQLEDWANTAVQEARAVTVDYEDARVVSGLRKPPPREGTLRIVTIEGLDRSACGGTHVTSTARLGSILVRGMERMRGRTRVGFLAGPRALAHFRRTEALLDRLAREAETSPEELVELLPRRREALKEAEARIAVLERELAENRVRALIDAASPGPGGVRWAVLRAEAIAPAALRHMAEAAAAEPGVAFVATSATSSTIAFSAHPETGIDAGARLKAALAAVGGRGGGSPRMAQGATPDPTLLDQVVATLHADP